MTEHLTAEIVQLTVSDITRAIEWMKCSYLYVRMKKACIIGAFLGDFFLDILFHLNYFLETMLNQNPEKYAFKKGIPGNLIEKYTQGTVMIHCYSCKVH